MAVQNGIMSAADKAKLDSLSGGLGGGAVSGVKGDAESVYRTGDVNLTAANIGAAAADHTHSQYAASNHTHTAADVGAAASNHTHSDYALSSHSHDAATTVTGGFMSKDDKIKLNGIAAGAQVNSVTGVKGNAESSYRTGNVNLTPANIGAAASNHTHTAADVGAAASNHTHSDYALSSHNHDTSYAAKSHTHTAADVGAAAASHGNHVPTTQTANNAIFLRNDNTWQTVTPANIGAAASSHTHSYAGSASAGGAATTALKTQNSASGSNAIDLVYAQVADNDYIRIRAGGTASNAGYLEISTADDAAEPIYFRQYTGVFSTLKRTATILDASGNTSFPGTVTAASFSGNLAGNAATATKFASVEAATTNVFRNVWFSDNTDDNKRVYDTDFQYNPSTNVLKLGSITPTDVSATRTNLGLNSLTLEETSSGIAVKSSDGTTLFTLPFAGYY